MLRCSDDFIRGRIDTGQYVCALYAGQIKGAAMTATIPATKYTRAIHFSANTKGGAIWVTEKRTSLTEPGTFYDHVFWLLVWKAPWSPAFETVPAPKRLACFRYLDA